MLILGIETSCDETGVALYGEEGLVAHRLYSQTELHAEFGGVVPELASRDHIRKLLPLIRSLLEATKYTLSHLSAIAYTAGPGLIGALMVGASIAKALAFTLGIPLIPVNHLEAHLLSPFINQPPPFPFLGLLVSGGHTILVHTTDLGKHTTLGETLDDAVGEAFDKVGKLLGFPYPGGAALSRLANQAGYASVQFPVPMLKHATLNFSFSGLKTYAINSLRENRLTKGELAYAFQKAAITALTTKTKRALQQFRIPRLVVAGGVSANQTLVQHLQSLTAKLGVKLHSPALTFCGDNGAMIAYTGYLYLTTKQLYPNDTIQVYPRLTLNGPQNTLENSFYELV